MAEKFSLKDHLFNEVKVKKLGCEIKQAFPDFDENSFVKYNMTRFPDLELKERITCIASGLKLHLTDDFIESTSIILKALPLPLDENAGDNDFGDFIYAPYGEYVANYGCNEEHLTFSLNALKEITKRFSVEYAIRNFINKFPEQTIKTIYSWTSDKNYHVRRLCSEGTRPKLPWGQKIAVNSQQTINILNKLFSDSTRFVTRSVANHLNDYSKSDPDLIIHTIKEWTKSKKQTDSEMQFITKHAFRNLVKDGNASALAMLGFSNPEGISLSNLVAPSHVKIGETLTFSFELHSTKEKKAVIDYTVYFQNKSGQMNSKKVHKLITVDLISDNTVNISKNHPFRANMTTRILYPGLHSIEIQINGEVKERFQFELY